MSTSTKSGPRAQLHVHDTPADLASSVASLLLRLSSAHTASRPLVIALSGGSLPAVVGAGLRAVPLADLRKHVPRWRFIFADERCVPHAHEDSNYRACREALLDYLAQHAGLDLATQVVPIREDLVGDSPAAAKAYAEVLGSHAVDVALLGMGPDGHTCSLFPGHALLSVRDTLVAGLDDSPKPPPSRITLTLPALHAATAVVYIATGASKQPALKAVLEADKAVAQDPASAKGVLPSALARPVGEGKELHWFVDSAAVATVPTEVRAEVEVAPAKL
ncbi:6-phosphogluconolactonase [Allomyces macrogynus ATCC 38327]|uniref:6-phosphogluconolactonase n=1 Tax=Allomyces macrogynus (strain ATCC 38327) TaxID=578462 RepID=A0A0L0SEJ5_ALLM3|nr:6-phosphogluconolactonase [Allomyces macrogynus ATCC 38327]|eukprot:KNE60854.1 6-phosphogluconolactonase [Allomyces macrogynus ATCC 38327]